MSIFPRSSISGGQLLATDVSGGVSVAYRAGGFAFDSTGKIYAEDLGAATVPAGAIRAQGLAFALDGRLYVTTAIPATTASRGAGLVIRADGALHVTSEAATLLDSLGGGIGRSPLGALRFSFSTPIATFGTVADPESAGSTLNKTTTWMMPQSLPIESVLKQFKCYATATGTIKVKVLQPVKGGGFNVISNQTLTISATGVNTFSVSAGTLTQVTMPAHSIVGFHTPASGGATISFSNAGVYAGRMGYLASTAGDLSGNGVSLNTFNYGAELQAQFTVEYDRSDVPADYIIDEDFASTIAPAWGVNNGTNAWSFAVAGQTTSAGTGLANKYCFFPTSNADRITWAVEFEYQASGDRFGIFRQPCLNDSSADGGTIVEFSLAGDIIFYRTWSGIGNDTLPATRSTTAITGLTLATGVRYRAELVTVGKLLRARIVRTSDSVSSQWVEVDNDSSDLAGYAHGRPGFFNIAGSIKVKSCQFYLTQTNPSVLVPGDSIAGDTGSVTQAQLWTQLLLNRRGGDGYYSSDGGTTSLNVLRRTRHELRYAMPRYGVPLAGANNSTSDALRDAYLVDMQELYDTFINRGVTPLICMPTPCSDLTRNGRLDVMRAGLIAKGWRLVYFNIAVSLNGDGSTYDASKMFDSDHMNAAGNVSMDARGAIDAPEVWI